MMIIKILIMIIVIIIMRRQGGRVERSGGRESRVPTTIAF